MIIPMNVRGLFYGKMHWRKGLFRMKPGSTEPQISMYINGLQNYQQILLALIEPKIAFKINDFEGYLK